jgi:hypothetical protein
MPREVAGLRGPEFLVLVGPCLDQRAMARDRPVVTLRNMRAFIKLHLMNSQTELTTSRFSSQED